jgi:hypothetical protein
MGRPAPDWDDWDEHELAEIRAGRETRRLPVPVAYSQPGPLVFTPEDLGKYPAAHEPWRRRGGARPAPDPDEGELHREEIAYERWIG